MQSVFFCFVTPTWMICLCTLHRVPTVSYMLNIHSPQRPEYYNISIYANVCRHWWLLGLRSLAMPSAALIILIFLLPKARRVGARYRMQYKN